MLACADEGGVAPLTRVAAKTGLSRESVRKSQIQALDRTAACLPMLPATPPG